MIVDLDFIKRTMQVQYAPFDWKKEHLKWNLDVEYLQAVNLIQEQPSITTKEFQQIAKQFLGSTQDYHVDITFYSTEFSLLPFSVKTVDGKCLVDWVEGQPWLKGELPLQVGDEIISFGGQPIKRVLENIKQAKGRLANTATDQALADNNLTFRMGASGDKVPKGNELIESRSHQTGKTQRHHLSWYHQAEKISSPLDFSALMCDLYPKDRLPEEILSDLLNKQCMITPSDEFRINEFDLKRGEVGASKSFLPLLGNPIWEFDASKSLQFNSSKESQIAWFAYIYKNEKGRPIGYLRIPHYSGKDEDFATYLLIMSYLEKNTDALIIDQLNNPGGYVAFMYQLLSLLTQDPLQVPKHRIAINQKQVMEAIAAIEKVESLSKLSNVFTIAQKEMLQQIRTYNQFIIDEWNRGEVLTHPTYLGGVECVKPHDYVHYSKPILMLINELDFSAGDFMPAILQDNRRAVLMGTKTAGAGGAVTKLSFPNRYGIKEISFTETIAERINLQKIENLGVMPDIEYKITAEDIQNGYQNYRIAINGAVNQLISN